MARDWTLGQIRLHTALAHWDWALGSSCLLCSIGIRLQESCVTSTQLGPCSRALCSLCLARTRPQALNHICLARTGQQGPNFPHLSETEPWVPCGLYSTRTSFWGFCAATTQLGLGSRVLSCLCLARTKLWGLVLPQLGWNWALRAPCQLCLDPSY